MRRKKFQLAGKKFTRPMMELDASFTTNRAVNLDWNSQEDFRTREQALGRCLQDAFWDGEDRFRSYNGKPI